MSFRKAERIVPNSAELEEGKLPAPNNFGILEYRSTLARYGDYIKYSDESTEFPIDDLHAAIVTEMGYAFKDFLEAKRIELMRTSKNKWYAGGAENRAGISTIGIDLSDLPKMAAFFARNNVTAAKDNYYVMIIPPEALIDLQTLQKSNDKFTYVEIAKDLKSADVFYRGAEGKMFRFIFVVSNSIHVEHEGDNEYAECIALGKVRGEWGTEEVSLEGANLPELINKGLETGGVENALNQVGSIGWKVHGWGGVVTHEEAVAIYTIKLSTPEYEAWDDTNRNSVDGVKSVKFVSGDDTKLTTTEGTTPVKNGR